MRSMILNRDYKREKNYKSRKKWPKKCWTERDDGGKGSGKEKVAKNQRQYRIILSADTASEVR